MGIRYQFVIAATILCFLRTVLGCSCVFPPYYSTPLESVCLDYEWSRRVFAARVINASCHCIPSVRMHLACLSGNVFEDHFTSKVVAETTCDDSGIRARFFGPLSCETILDKFKPIDCPYEGQVFMDCTSLCPTTCSNMGVSSPCPSVCVGGCGCPEGMVIDEEQRRCVMPSQCPDKGCPFVGQVTTLCSSSCPQDCFRPGNESCVQLCDGCACPPPAIADYITGRCVQPEQCTACPIEGQVYTECGSSCPRTCDNVNDTILCTTECWQGCECPPGMVIDVERRRCAEPSQCIREPPTVIARNSTQRRLCEESFACPFNVHTRNNRGICQYTLEVSKVFKGDVQVGQIITDFGPDLLSSCGDPYNILSVGTTYVVGIGGPCTAYGSWTPYSRYPPEHRQALANGCNPVDDHVSELCLQPVEAGPCHGYFPRWFYNSTSERCEQFIYGGCKGNVNRFETRENCENACKCDICTLQPVTGHCRARFSRHFYNITSGSCEVFTYGGCGGNENRFETSAECTATCYGNSSCPVRGQVYEACPSNCQGTCDNPVEACTLACTGGGCVCPAGQVIDTEANRCVHPSQCPINCLKVQCPEVSCAFGNATIPPGSCCPVCVCNIGDEVHFSGEVFKRDCNNCSCSSGWLICTNVVCEESPSSPLNRTCPIEGQEYTECGTACPLTCKAPDPVSCTQQCVPGCQCPIGTVLDEDNKRCVEPKLCPIPPCDVCSLQPDTGPCRGFFSRYFWNNNTRQCEQFTYGGCRGNLNRFSSLDMCQSKCGPPDCLVTVVNGNIKYNERRKRTVLRFSSDGDPKVTYQCKLDDDKFKDCKSPMKWKNLKKGRYAIIVRAFCTDDDGEISTTTRRRFKFQIR